MPGLPVLLLWLLGKAGEQKRQVDNKFKTSGVALSPVLAVRWSVKICHQSGSLFYHCSKAHISSGPLRSLLCLLLTIIRNLLLAEMPIAPWMLTSQGCTPCFGDASHSCTWNAGSLWSPPAPCFVSFVFGPWLHLCLFPTRSPPLWNIFLTVSFASKHVSPPVNSLALFEDLSSLFITCFGCFHFSVMSIWATHWSFLFSDSHLCLIISLMVAFFTLSSLPDLPNLSQIFVFKVIATSSVCFHVIMSHVLTPSSGWCSPWQSSLCSWIIYLSFEVLKNLPSLSHTTDSWASDPLDRLIR